MRRGPFLLLFALSGAAALVYEVVWTRLLTLQIGHGLAAASTVLAAFMGGLAIGAAAGGRIGQRMDPPAGSTRLRRTRSRNRGHRARSAVAPPRSAAGPGGALRQRRRRARVQHRAAALEPRAVVPASGRDGRHLPAGLAVAREKRATGAGRGGPAVRRQHARRRGGRRRHRLRAAALARVDGSDDRRRCAQPGRSRRSLVAGRPRRRDGRTRRASARPASRKTRPTGPSGRPWLAAAALGVTGFASLALQVVWTRLLASMLGPTTYAFSAVVAIFILGIASGSALAAWLSRRLQRPVAALGAGHRRGLGAGPGGGDDRRSRCCWPSPRSWLARRRPSNRWSPGNGRSRRPSSCRWRSPLARPSRSPCRWRPATSLRWWPISGWSTRSTRRAPSPARSARASCWCRGWASTTRSAWWPS